MVVIVITSVFSRESMVLRGTEVPLGQWFSVWTAHVITWRAFENTDAQIPCSEVLIQLVWVFVGLGSFSKL